MANEITVRYNVGSDEFIREVDTTFRRVNEITRMNNDEQIRLMQNVYENLSRVLENYVSRVKMTYDVMSDIFKNTWDISSADATKYFDEVGQKMDRMIDNMKNLSDKEVAITKDTVRQKIEAFKDETTQHNSEVKKRSDFRLSESIKTAGANVQGFVSGTGAFEGSTISTLMGMGTSAITAPAALMSTAPRPDVTVKELANVVQGGLGLMIKAMKDVDNMKRQLMLSYGGMGTDIKSIYGGELSMMDENSVLSGLQKTHTRFAGTLEFTEQAQLQLMQQFMGSRVMGKGTDYSDVGTDATLLGRARNMPSSEVANFFIELRQKLDEPIENLTGRFFQLDNISKDLGLNLRQVISDYQTMMVANQKMGFSQEEVMGLYKDFGEELKKGTISASQLSEYMRGIANLGTDQSVGVAALLTQNPEQMLANFQGNQGNAQRIIDLLSTAQQQGGDLDATQILRMINNPDADFSKSPFLQQLMEKYGFSQEELGGLNPEVERMIRAQSLTMAQQNGQGPGAGRTIYEKLMGLMGMQLPGNLYESGLMEQGIGKVGTTTGVMGLKQAGIEGRGLMESTAKNLEDISPFLVQFERTIDIMMRRYAANTEEVWKKNKDQDDRFKKVFEQLKTDIEASTIDLGNLIGVDFRGSVEKFDSTIDKFGKIMKDIQLGTVVGGPIGGVLGGLLSLLSNNNNEGEANRGIGPTLQKVLWEMNNATKKSG